MSFTHPSREVEFLFNKALPIAADWRRWGLELTWSETAAMLEMGVAFADEQLAPLNASGDAEGCRLDHGQVFAPKGFKEAYAQLCELGFPAVDSPDDVGGQNLPHSLGFALGEMWCGANMAFSLYHGLTHGAAHLLHAHGDNWLRTNIVPKLVRGEWGGTMCLTEPQCGTDLGLLKTTATADGDQGGAYLINGAKLFISSGDHDLTTNIVHLVLARTPGAPPGLKFLSLFAVPKLRWDDSGNLTTVANGVTVGSLEHKMGIKGSATTVLNFDNARGVLVGAPNRGLAIMFTMMNEARLSVALQGLGVAQRAYDISYAYAQERLASRSPLSAWQHPDLAADPIIGQPDVRRMLLTQKAYVGGARFLLLFLAHQLDISRFSQDAGERDAAANLVSLLTPVAKAFITDNAIAGTSLAMQVLGGHGYVRDSGLEQLARDVRVTAIYEGTNGVQALDLLGRKVFGKQGATLQQLAMQVLSLLDVVAKDDNGRWQGHAAVLRDGIMTLGQITGELGAAAANDPAVVHAAANDYLRYLGYIVYGYAWLLMAHAESAQPSLGPEMRQSLHTTVDFFFQHLWPQTYAHKAVLSNPLAGLTSSF